MIRKKLFILVVLLFILFTTITAFGQNNTPYTPKIIPPSPNAASLGKFGDIPVSPYTGTTDVSIPIYTIQGKGLSVPITLDYHTGGIRLSEEASWVGLGWALNAGGMISRTINDKDDFIGGYFNSSLIYPMPEAKGRLIPYTLYPTQPYLGNWGYEFACNYEVHTELGDVNYLSAFKQAFTSVGTYDFEPDTYSFNFLGRSGKFIIGRDGKIVLQKQENLKIEFGMDASYFIITDEQGNKYYFSDKEYEQPAIGGATSVSSWMLSKIVTQLKDSILFHYNVDNTWSTVKGISHEILRNGVTDETPVYSNDPGTSYKNQTLQTIDYDNCQIQFSFSGNRSDLQNGKKLDTIKIYTKDQTGLKYLKGDQLYYSYFNPVTGVDTLEFKRLRLDSVKEVSGSLSVPPYSFIYNQAPGSQGFLGKHYSSVDHWGYFNGVSNAIYGNNTLGFTPPFVGLATLHGVSTYLDLPGANREPDPGYMQTFSLNQVNYPTGGHTVFEYEPNYYDYANSIAGREGRDYEYVAIQDKIVQAVVHNNGSGNYSGSIDLSDIYMTNSTYPTATLTIAFRASGSDSLNHYHNGMSFGNVNFTFQNNISDITDASLYCSGTMTGNNCSGNVYSASRQLIISSPTTYTWSAHIDPKVSTSGFLDITATFTYKTPLFRQQTILMAGGLRIKSIRDYSANGKLAKKRTYDYTYQQDRDNNGVNETYSYGRLMGYLSYARNEVISSDQSPSYATSLTRYSSSFSAFTSQSSGNIVGYDQVTEYTIDSASGLDNGKTVYTFYNSSDTTFSYGGYRFPGVLNLPSNLNGLPKSKSLYARSVQGGYNRISTTDYYYHSGNRIIYDAFKWTHYPLPGIGRDDPADPVLCSRDTHGNALNTGCNCPTGVDTAGYQLTADFYPVISSEIVLLDSTIETTLNQNDTTIQFKNITRNYYDNPKHYQLTRLRVIDSKGSTHVTYTKYPQDYLPANSNTIGNTVLDSMIQKNMVSAPIEIRDSLYVSGASSGFVTGARVSLYKLLSTDHAIVPEKQFSLDLPSPVTNFTPLSFSGNTISKDSRYRQRISFDSYDAADNIQQYTLSNQPVHSYIWDYSNSLPVAETINANQPDIAYTSFESDGKGNWNNYAGTIVTAAASPFPPTGTRYYNLTTTNTLSKAVTNGKKYVISYWSKNGSYSVTGGTGSVVTGITINGWTFYYHTIQASSTLLTISGTGAIDEVRLYPSGAQMTTYTYSPLIGLTSQTDINNRTSYYEYDGLGRLKDIKDQDGNILKTFDYHYKQ